MESGSCCAPACSPSPQISPFLPSTGRSLSDKERRVTCEDPPRASTTQVLASVKLTFRSPSQSVRACCQLSSVLGKSHLGQGHEEDAGREDRDQPDLEEGQEIGQDWTREDKRYWAQKRKFTVGRPSRECLSQISTYLFRSFWPLPSGHHFTTKCSVE